MYYLFNDEKPLNGYLNDVAVLAVKLEVTKAIVIKPLGNKIS